MPQIDLKETQLYIVDGSGSPNVIEVTIGEGNVTWTENRELEYTLNRGLLASGSGGTVREGDDQPMSVSFDIRWDEYRSDDGVVVTPVDALQQEGAAAAWVSVDSDVCTPYAVDLQLIRDLGSCFAGTNQYEKYLFTSFRWESIDHDVDAGQMSVSGTCQVTKVTATREASDPTPS